MQQLKLETYEERNHAVEGILNQYITHLISNGNRYNF